MSRRSGGWLVMSQLPAANDAAGWGSVMSPWRASAVADDVMAPGDVTTSDSAADKAALMDSGADDVTVSYTTANDVTASYTAADDVTARTRQPMMSRPPPRQPIVSLDVIALDAAASDVALAAL